MYLIVTWYINKIGIFIIFVGACFEERIVTIRTPGFTYLEVHYVEESIRTND